MYVDTQGNKQSTKNNIILSVRWWKNKRHVTPLCVEVNILKLGSQSQRPENAISWVVYTNILDPSTAVVTDHTSPYIPTRIRGHSNFKIGWSLLIEDFESHPWPSVTVTRKKAVKRLL